MYLLPRLLGLWLLLGSSVLAQDATLPPAEEVRAKALFSELRCVVCQNQSIASSDADVAKDLRQIVREQIGAGRSDAQVRDYLVARYGEFILLKPGFAPHTVILWLTPVILLLLGGVAALVAHRSRNRQAGTVLTQDEEARLSALLDETDNR